MPNDVGLVAIDDPFWAELVDPPLTTLAQLVQRMAESAVELLFERITGGDRNQTQTKCLVFSFELRRRGSCGTVGLPQGMAETSR